MRVVCVVLLTVHQLVRAATTRTAHSRNSQYTHKVRENYYGTLRKSLMGLVGLQQNPCCNFTWELTLELSRLQCSEPGYLDM